MNAPTSAKHLSQAASPEFTLSAHPDHPRLVHVTLDNGALAGFLEDVKEIDVQNLQYVPFMRFHIAQALIDRLGVNLSSRLVALVKDRNHGGFTIGLQGVSNDSDDYVKFGTAVAHILGPSNHDAMSGT